MSEHSSSAGYNTYGHEIRNLLIVACTEVEAQWKGILQANGYCRNRYTTNDYVILNRAMLLDQYVVSLPHYPWLPPFKPFQGWGSSGKPTEELSWYSAYNRVKHDREQNFSEAKLVHAIDAVCACMIMLFTQYGKHQQRSGGWIAPPFGVLRRYMHPYEGHASGFTAVKLSLPVIIVVVRRFWSIAELLPKKHATDS